MHTFEFMQLHSRPFILLTFQPGAFTEPRKKPSERAKPKLYISAPGRLQSLAVLSHVEINVTTFKETLFCLEIHEREGSE